MIRYSNVIAFLRLNSPNAAAVVERLRKSVGRSCPAHGLLEDPIVIIIAGTDQIAFGCPACSGDAVRQAWEAEGPGENHDLPDGAHGARAGGS